MCFFLQVNCLEAVSYPSNPFGTLDRDLYPQLCTIPSRHLDVPVGNLTLKNKSSTSMDVYYYITYWKVDMFIAMCFWFSFKCVKVILLNYMDMFEARKTARCSNKNSARSKAMRVCKSLRSILGGGFKYF